MTIPVDTPARTESTPRITTGLLITLALLSAVAPFATDLYLPAFPEMVSDLHTSPTNVQLTLTTFLLGLALGQLRSEEHTSELQSLMRISYAVFCLKKKK